MSDPRSTNEVRLIAAGQIAEQARLCTVNLESVKDKIEGINGDMGDIAKALTELKKTVTDLTLEVKTKFTEMNAEIRSLKHRWSIWPTLKDILIVIVSLASLGLTVYAMLK